MNIKFSEIVDLMSNQGYVFLRTDKGYDETKKNSIKDHYDISTIDAQNTKKNPAIQAFIKSLNDVVLIMDVEEPKEEIKQEEASSDAHI